VKRLVLFGPWARNEVQWRVVEGVLERLDLEGVAIAPRLAALSPARHRQNTPVAEPPTGSRFVEILDLPAGRRMRRALGILRQLRALDPDVVVLTIEPHERENLDALAALTLLRRPLVLAFSMENEVTLPAGWRGRAIRFLWRRIDILAAGATATIESFGAAGLPRSTPAVPLVAAVAGPPADLGERTPHERFRIAYVGRLVPEKGVPELVEAVRDLPDVELALAGPGPLESELRALAETAAYRGRLTVLGLTGREGVWQLLRDADLLALLSRSRPGWREQFGYVLGEAMAVGTPLLGSDSGAIPEVVGGAGLVVREGSAADAAEAIARLAADPALCARLGAAARTRYVQEFSIDACARKVTDLIEAAR
jgi:glycosyltransferase involved in cell wall biosynthesis